MSEPQFDLYFAVLEVRAFDIYFVGLPGLGGVYGKVFHERVAAHHYRGARIFVTFGVKKMRPHVNRKFIIFSFLDCRIGAGGKEYRTRFFGLVHRDHKRVGVGMVAVCVAGRVRSDSRIAQSSVYAALVLGIHAVFQIDHAVF